MQALLCSLMWVDVVLHVKLRMILLQIIVIGYNMDALLTRVLRILKTGMDGRFIARTVVKLIKFSFEFWLEKIVMTSNDCTGGEFTWRHLSW